MLFIISMSNFCYFETEVVLINFSDNINNEHVYSQLRQRSSSRSLCKCKPLCETLSYKSQITYSDLYGMKDFTENPTFSGFAW